MNIISYLDYLTVHKTQSFTHQAWHSKFSLSDHGGSNPGSAGHTPYKLNSKYNIVLYYKLPRTHHRTRRNNSVRHFRTPCDLRTQIFPV